MAMRITPYILSAKTRDSQRISMPRRAKITGGHTRQEGTVRGTLSLYALVEEDANTKAFDVKHHRHFVVCQPGDMAPEGLLVAVVDEYHIFEVKP